MIITIHQPNYLPWSGFFHRLSVGDKFVVFDDVQYMQGGVMNRNKIRTAEGWQWLTVPVLVKGRLSQLVSEAKVNNSDKWQKKHWNAIQMSYSKARYFDTYAEDLKGIILDSHWDRIMDLNMALISYFLQALGVSTEIVYSSSVPRSPAKDDKTENLVDLCKAVGATVLVTGHGSEYFEDETFKAGGIQHIALKYHHPTYQQRYPGFEPNMSVLDLLLNNGDRSREVLADGNVSNQDELIAAHAVKK